MRPCSLVVEYQYLRRIHRLHLQVEYPGSKLMLTRPVLRFASVPEHWASSEEVQLGIAGPAPRFLYLGFRELNAFNEITSSSNCALVTVYRSTLDIGVSGYIGIF
jgi:hypothetical protein